MNFILGNMAANKTDLSEKSEGWHTKNDVWKTVIETMVDPTSGMDEPQRADYEQKIMQKMQAGRKLTPEELDYLRIHNPEMYKIAVRVETDRKVLKTKLNNCKSKEEVQQVISTEMEVLKAMKGDPAQPYMMAMVSKEVQNFKKSSKYARLPEKEEKEKKKSGEEEILRQKEAEDAKEDVKLFQKAAAYNVMQVHCEQIGELAQSYLSA